MSDPTEAELLDLMSELSNWGRWGDDDERGTLNHIDSANLRAAAALVQQGRSVSCQRPVSWTSSEHGAPPCVHFMIASGESARDGQWGGATDWFGMPFHGSSITHLDSLGHVYWDRKIYNGREASVVGTTTGVGFGAVDVAFDGITSRGVLLDLPRHLDTPYLEPGEAIGPDVLDACLAAQSTSIGSGDVLLIRNGRDAAPTGPSAQPGKPGLSADCLRWLASKEIALLGSDYTSDVHPARFPNVQFPIHVVGIVYLGLWLLDNAELGPLARSCVELNRWEFMFSIAPLRLRRSTGSPVNPLAFF